MAKRLERKSSMGGTDFYMRAVTYSKSVMTVLRRLTLVNEAYYVSQTHVVMWISFEVQDTLYKGHAIEALETDKC